MSRECSLLTLPQKKQTFECRACKNKTAISQLYIPYAAKLLFQVRNTHAHFSEGPFTDRLLPNPGIAEYEHRCPAIYSIYRPH